MKCILIEPPWTIAGLSETESLAGAPCYPPIGLAYVAAVLREDEVEVKIIDAKSLRLRHEEVYEIVARENPDIVGVTAFTRQIKGVLKTCEEIKRRCPSVKIVLGGPHIHAEHESVIKNDFIDFCVRGEAELTISELVEAISNGGKGDLKKVRGLTFKDGTKVIVTQERPFIRDLDTLPFPARDLLPNHIYRGLIPFGDNVFTLMTATRGCPFKCHFCSVPQFWYEHRRRSVENVLEELEHISEIHKIGCVRFTDELLPVSKKWLLRFCKELVDRGLSEKIAWSCDGHVAIMTAEMLEAMKKANCKHLFYGIEFGNQRILDFSGKGTTLAQIHKTIEATKEAGISIEGNYLIGYPTETKETIEDTTNLAMSLNCDYTTFTVVMPFPGTLLYQYCKENDLLRTNNWEEYNYVHLTEKGGIIKLEHITNEELMELFNNVHREFYCKHEIEKVGRDILGLVELEEEVVAGMKNLSASVDIQKEVK